jgi:hypothetical protein
MGPYGRIAPVALAPLPMDGEHSRAVVHYHRKNISSIVSKREILLGLAKIAGVSTAFLDLPALSAVQKVEYGGPGERDVVILSSGVQYADISKGSGEALRTGSLVVCILDRQLPRPFHKKLNNVVLQQQQPRLDRCYISLFFSQAWQHNNFQRTTNLLPPSTCKFIQLLGCRGLLLRLIIACFTIHTFLLGPICPKT